MQPILECCCGADVHKDMIEACIIRGAENPIFIRKQFQTLPSALQDFVQWLFENDCFHIAMESTGIYWRPVMKRLKSFRLTMKVSSFLMHTICAICRAERPM